MHWKRTKPKTIGLLHILSLFFATHSQILSATIPGLLSPSISNAIEQRPITSIFQDRNGFLWIGTQQGVFRYDGASQLHYSNGLNSDGHLPVNDIRGITEDSLGRIIVASFNGEFLRYIPDRDAFEFIETLNLKKFASVTQIRDIDEKAFLVIGNKEAHVLSRDLQKLHIISPSSSRDESRVIAAVRLPSANLLISTEFTIYRFDTKRDKFLSLLSAKSGEKFTSMIALRDGRIAITTNQGLLKIFDHEISKVVDEWKLERLKESHVTTIAVHDSLIVIGTDDGVIATEIDSKNTYLFTQENSHLRNDHVSAFFSSQEHLWIGTYQGLNVLTLSPFISHDTRSTGGLNDVLSFAEDRHGNIFIGAYDGLFQYVASTGSHRRYEVDIPDQIKGKPIITMKAVGSRLWMGSWRGGLVATYIDGMREDEIVVPGFSEALVTSLASSEDQLIWVATYNQGLYRINTATLAKEAYLPNTPLTIVKAFDDGTVITAGPKSIHQFDPIHNEFRPMNLKWSDSDERPFVLSIATLASGNILFGTKDHGIYSWDKSLATERNSGLSRVISNQALGAITANSIQVDERGAIWCATGDGLLRIDASLAHISRFGAEVGIPSADFNANSSFVDSRGKFYFGGPKGYTEFFPNKVSASKYVAPIRLTSIETIGDTLSIHRNVAETNLVELDWSVRAITISYSTQDYLNIAGYRYRHRLQNFDPDWIEDGGRKSATYTNLPPGDYVFEVQAADATGVWGEEGVRLNVRVLPPPWQTWWAYTLYAIMASLILYFGKRRYDRRLLNERALDYAEEVQANSLRIEDELQESHEYYDEQLRRVNGHHRDTLGLIRDSVLSPIEDEHLRENLDVLSLLDDCPSQSGDPLAVDLKQVVDEIIVRKLPCATVPAEKITIINNVPDRPIHGRLAGPLALATAELLENALAHAFEPSSQANFIEIDLSTTGEPDTPAYQLQVRDDGTGIPDEVVTSATSPGLALLHRLADSFGGSLEFRVDAGTTAIFKFSTEQ